MSDQHDDQRRTGPRQVYRRGDGTYHVEAVPGAGPEHHDDLKLTPEDVERKAHGDDPSAELNLPHPLIGDSIEPSAEHKRIMDLGAMAEQMNSKVLIVIGPRGGLQAAYLGSDSARANAHARALSGVVVEIPISVDYR